MCVPWGKFLVEEWESSVRSLASGDFYVSCPLISILSSRFLVFSFLFQGERYQKLCTCAFVCHPFHSFLPILLEASLRFLGCFFLLSHFFIAHLTSCFPHLDVLPRFNALFDSARQRYHTSCLTYLFFPCVFSPFLSPTFLFSFLVHLFTLSPLLHP